MNKNLNKVLALLTALVLLVALAGCLETPAAGTDAQTEPSASAETAPDAGIDYTAPAIELGDVVITVQDLADLYNDYAYYMQYYGMEVDPATALSYAEDSSISSYVNIWQAQVQGITLTDEDKAKVEEEVQTYRQELVDSFIDYLIEQGTAEADATEAVALETIEQQLAEGGYEGGLETYLSDYVRKETENLALSDKVQKTFTDTITVTDEEIRTWYDTTVESQTAAFAESPADFQTIASDFASDMSTTPALVTPEGFVRVNLVEILPAVALDAAYETNKTEMTALEAEYGALVLKGENEARQAEIVARYAELKTANEALYETYIKDARDNADKAKTALDGGTAFADVMKTYNVAEAVNAEQLLYTVAEEPTEVDAALIQAVAELEDGAYSGVVQVDDAFYIVQLVGKAEAGTLTFDDCKEQCAAAALADKQASEWAAISDEWLNQAKEIAVYHKEAYEGITTAAVG